LLVPLIFPSLYADTIAQQKAKTHIDKPMSHILGSSYEIPHSGAYISHIRLMLAMAMIRFFISSRTIRHMPKQTEEISKANIVLYSVSWVIHFKKSQSLPMTSKILTLVLNLIFWSHPSGLESFLALILQTQLPCHIFSRLFSPISDEFDATVFLGADIGCFSLGVLVHLDPVDRADGGFVFVCMQGVTMMDKWTPTVRSNPLPLTCLERRNSFSCVGIMLVPFMYTFCNWSTILQAWDLSLWQPHIYR